VHLAAVEAPLLVSGNATGDMAMMTPCEANNGVRAADGMEVENNAGLSM
jgi:hypothetical protein